MSKQTELSLGWPSRKLTAHLRREFEARVVADLFEKKKQTLLRETKEAGRLIYECLWGNLKNLEIAHQLPEDFFPKASYLTLNFNAKNGNKNGGQSITVSFDCTTIKVGQAYGSTVNFNDCKRLITPAGLKIYGMSTATSPQFKDNKKLAALGKKWAEFTQNHNTVLNKVREIINSVNTEKQLLTTWPDSHKYMTPPNVVMSIVPSVKALDELMDGIRG